VQLYEDNDVLSTGLVGLHAWRCPARLRGGMPPSYFFSPGLAWSKTSLADFGLEFELEPDRGIDQKIMPLSILRPPERLRRVRLFDSYEDG
jgi:hypothetical protein